MRRTPAAGDRVRQAPGLFLLAATARAPAGARDGGWATHERRAAARAAAHADEMLAAVATHTINTALFDGRRSPHRHALLRRTGTAADPTSP